MKRSKIFLGITTGVLAVVAFTAGKTTKFSTSIRAGYYTNPGNLKCTLAGGAAYSTLNVGSGFNQATAAGNFLYSYNSGSTCIKPLFTDKQD